MAETTYTLTDSEWAEALRVGMDAAHKARFEDGKPDEAAQIGIDAGTAHARQIAIRRVSGG